ncbi:MAG: histidine phosphatase family protein [Chlamydiota bacterium]
MIRFFIFCLFLGSYAFVDACHLIIIRHGETAALANRIYHEDSGLNEQGEKQALEVIDKLHGVPIDAIYSSPLRRAIQTASPLAEHRALPVIIYGALKERGHGSAEGRPMADFDGTETRDLYYHPQKSEDLFLRLVPDAENLDESTKRFSSILKKISEEHPDQTVVVFSHHALMQGLLISLTNRFDHPPILNGSFIQVTGSEDALVLRANAREGE